MTDGWEARRRAAVEAAAIELIANRRADPRARQAAKAEIERPTPDVRRLTDDELHTLRAIQRKLIGAPMDGYYLRVHGEQPQYRPCPDCTERRARTYIDVSWAAHDEDLLAAIVEALDAIRTGETTHDEAEVPEVEASLDPAIASGDHEGGPVAPPSEAGATVAAIGAGPHQLP